MTLRILLALCLALLAAPAAAHGYSIGMSDQKLGMWQDPRFNALELKQVRLLVQYDRVLKGDFAQYDPWILAAQHRGNEILLTIDRSASSYTRLPGVRQYRKVIRILRKRYPEIEVYAPWNEANHYKQPTYRNPRKAAQYYNILRDECPQCTVVAADVLDQSNMLPWLEKFRRYADGKPRLWGLHSYQDANHFRPLHLTATQQLLRAVKGEIWLTETGGIVRFGVNYPGGRAGEEHAARAMKRTFKVARISPRIKRVYLYHWDADPKFVTWDSAFVDRRGQARPTLEILRKELNRIRRKNGEPVVPPLSRRRGKTVPLY